MNNTILLEVLNCKGKLFNYFADPFFRQLVFSLLQIVVEVFAFAALKHNKVIALIFEVVDHPDHVRVLYHFEDVYFPARLIDFDDFHISFAGCFERYFLSRVQMLAVEDLTELALPKGRALEGEAVLNL